MRILLIMGFNQLTTDSLSKKILKTLQEADSPLETKEVMGAVTKSGGTITQVRYRLDQLRAENTINGKMLSAGHGVWIWWKKEAFK